MAKKEEIKEVKEEKKPLTETAKKSVVAAQVITRVEGETVSQWKARCAQVAPKAEEDKK